MTTGLEGQLGLVLKTFDSNVKSVKALMEFDRVVVQFARHQLSVVETKLEGLHEYSGARSAARNAIRECSALVQPSTYLSTKNTKCFLPSAR
jgi:hypothetical protein